jgi:hypothetical protein
MTAPPITFQTSASEAAISKMAPSNVPYRFRPSAAMPTNSSSIRGISSRMMSVAGEDNTEKKRLRVLPSVDLTAVLITKAD